MNWSKIVLNPKVNVPVAEDMPTPMCPLKSSRNSVEATLSDKVVVVRPVWSRRRKRSLIRILHHYSSGINLPSSKDKTRSASARICRSWVETMTVLPLRLSIWSTWRIFVHSLCQGCLWVHPPKLTQDHSLMPLQRQRCCSPPLSCEGNGFLGAPNLPFLLVRIPAVGFL